MGNSDTSSLNESSSFTETAIQAPRNTEYGFTFNETFVDVESRPPRWEDRFNNGGQAIPTHPWEVTQIVTDNRNKLFVRSGKVITAEDEAPFEAPFFPGKTFEMIFPQTAVYLKFVRDINTDELLKIEVSTAAVLPENTATNTHWVIADVTVKKNARGGLYVDALNQRMFEDIRLYLSDGGSDFNHMWRATCIPATENTPASLNVSGGVVVVQGARVDVADASFGLGDSGTQYVVLAVARELNSRAYNSSSAPTILVATSYPVSSNTAEHTVLAEITAVTTPPLIEGDPATITYSVKQCRNDEICSYELLLVENGEFKLLPLQANSRNSYDVPTPSSV